MGLFILSIGGEPGPERSQCGNDLVGDVPVGHVQDARAKLEMPFLRHIYVHRTAERLRRGVILVIGQLTGTILPVVDFDGVWRCCITGGERPPSLRHSRRGADGDVGRCALDRGGRGALVAPLEHVTEGWLIVTVDYEVVIAPTGTHQNLFGPRRSFRISSSASERKSAAMRCIS